MAVTIPEKPGFNYQPLMGLGFRTGGLKFTPRMLNIRVYVEVKCTNLKLLQAGTLTRVQSLRLNAV